MAKEIKIDLNTVKEVMWGIPGTQIYLNAINPSLTFGLDALDPKQRLMLSLAVRSGRVTSNLSPDEIFLPSEAEALRVSSTITTQIQRPTQQPIAKPVKVVTPEEVHKNAKQILSSVVAIVRKEIAGCKDMRLLKALIQEEEKGKRRKMLLSLMRIKLSEFEEAATKVAMDDSNPADMSKVGKILPGPLSKLLAEKVTYEVEELESSTAEIEVPEK